MSLAARAVYLDLLFYVWERAGAIPSDHDILAKLTFVSIDQFERIWPELQDHIIPHPERPGSLTNLVMLDQVVRRGRYVDAGREGGIAKAQRNQTLASDGASDGASVQGSDGASDAASDGASVSLPCKVKVKYKTEVKAKTNTHTQCEKNFTEFWEAWPVKDGMDLTAQFYSCLIDEGLAHHLDIMAGLRRQIKSDRWQESLRDNAGKFIPSAANWLRGRRWLDQGAPERGDASDAEAERMERLGLK